MMWGAFGYHGKSELVTIPLRSNSETYQDVLRSKLIHQGSKLGGRGWIYQQDNAPIHTSRSTMNFLQTEGVRLLDWPSRSPDLNPMENAWAELSRRVYRHGRQYKSKKELEQAIHDEWNAMPQEYFQNLIGSMKNRIFQLILKQGGYTGY